MEENCIKLGNLVVKGIKNNGGLLVGGEVYINGKKVICTSLRLGTDKAGGFIWTVEFEGRPEAE